MPFVLETPTPLPPTPLPSPPTWLTTPVVSLVEVAIPVPVATYGPPQREAGECNETRTDHQ